VAGDADGPDAGHVRGVGVEPLGLGERDAELVLRLAGGDLGVTAGLDVGVHANSYRGADAQTLRDPVDQLQFRLRFDIDLGDAGLEGELDLGLGLADT
jgi:hypothetical protein